MYHKKHQRDMFCFFGQWCIGGIIVFLLCLIYCREKLPAILVCVFFTLILIIAGINGIREIRKRQKEIQGLISAGKYLAGQPEDIVYPEYTVYIRGMKCMKFRCISENGREYHFHSEPFDTRKKYFSENDLYKIYVDDLNCPKKYFVSDEAICN